MVKITLDLVRKRAEHNDGELSTLEELSLHQMDIEKMEYLHRWCPNLRILYLQGNLIAKIENVGRLRGLEYLNLALNNLESVSGLERCEALQKLDLTANFIIHLTSLLTLQDLPNLTQLYMTGNPCTDYRGYRTWVLCNLWALGELDGVKVTRGERLRALQNLTSAHATVSKDQQEALDRRAREKMKQQQQEGNDEGKDSDNDSDNEEKWWEGTSEHTPESRITTHRHIATRRHKQQQAREYNNNNNNKKKENAPRLFTTDGRPMNVNSANLQFKFTEDEQENTFVLDVNTYKYLDPSLVSCSVEPWYVRVTVRGKILQLVLLEEVRPGQATACRSQITGHLVVTMPKLAPPPRWLQQGSKCKQKISPVVSSSTTTTILAPAVCHPPTPASAVCHPLPPRDQLEKKGCVEYLEVGEERRGADYTNIVNKEGDDVVVPPSDTHPHYNLPPLRPNSPGFQDNSEVPPLE